MPPRCLLECSVQRPLEAVCPEDESGALKQVGSADSEGTPFAARGKFTRELRTASKPHVEWTRVPGPLYTVLCRPPPRPLALLSTSKRFISMFAGKYGSSQRSPASQSLLMYSVDRLHGVFSGIVGHACYEHCDMGPHLRRCPRIGARLNLGLRRSTSSMAYLAQNTNRQWLVRLVRRCTDGSA